MKRPPSIHTCYAAAAIVLAIALNGCELNLDGLPPQTDYRAILLNPTDDFWQAKAPERYRVRITTTKGPFVLELHRDWAPIGVDRFYNLVRSGYFDQSRVSRVKANFIAQFGIAGEPAIAQAWRHQELKDDPVVETNTRGTIAFAMTGPDTRTTQLYINLVDNVRLDEQGFSPLGRVVEGMDVVDSLYWGYDDDSGGGMRLGQQDPVFEGGNEWLDANYPLLDKLIGAQIEQR